MATPATPTPNAFDDAFKLLSEDSPAGGAAPAGAPPAEPEPEPQVEPEPKPEPAEGDEGGLPDPSTVDPAEGDEPKPEPAPKGEPAKEPTAAEFLQQFRDLVAQAPKPAAEPPAPAREAPPEVTPFSEEEQGVVDTYLRDFGDVYRAEQLIRRQEYQALTAHIFKQLNPVLQQLGSQTQQLVTQTHMEQLQAAVPDYATVVPKVREWVDKQPAYLKPAYEAVVKQGTVSDVVDLIGRYRAATGTPAPGAAPAPAAKPAPAKKAIQGLAPVGSKRTGVSTDVVANDDFDGAFAAAARES